MYCSVYLKKVCSKGQYASGLLTNFIYIDFYRKVVKLFEAIA